MNLTTADTDLFYKLHRSLLVFANRQFDILPKEIAPEQVGVQPIEQVARLRDALYAKPELLDAYLAANPDRLVSEELGILAS